MKTARTAAGYDRRAAAILLCGITIAALAGAGVLGDDSSGAGRQPRGGTRAESPSVPAPPTSAAGLSSAASGRSAAASREVAGRSDGEETSSESASSGDAAADRPAREGAGQAAGSKAAGETAGTKEPARKTLLEQLLFVPYSKLQDVLERTGSVIFVPYAEYLRLWSDALRAREAEGGAPVAAVIRSIEYAAAAQRDRVVVDASMDIRALKGEWSELPIGFAGLAVASIVSKPSGVLLRGTADGGYRLIFRTAGEYRVQIRLEGRVRTSPDGKQVQFQCPPVAVTRLTLDVDEPDQTVQIEPAVSVRMEAAPEGHTVARAALPSTGQIVARWHPRVSRKPQMELLTSVQNLAQVRIQDGLVHTDATLKFKVLRGELREIRIGVARAHNILDVASPDARVQGWSVDDSGPFQIVTVKLLAPVTSEATVEVHTERPQPTEAFPVSGRTDRDVFGIHALDATRESGQIVIVPAAELTVAVEEQTGIARIDPNEADPSIRRKDGLAFKYFNPRFVLRIRVQPIRPRIEVTHNARFVFDEDELRLQADLEYTVERTGVFEVSFRVPESLNLQTVSGPVVKEHRFDASSRTVTVTLKQKTLGQIAVQVRAVRKLPANQSSVSLVLPMLELLGVDRETGHIQVYAPEALEVITDAAQVSGAQPEPPSQAAPIPRARLVSAWSFNRPPVKLPVTTRRRPTHLTATVATTIAVHPERTQVVTQLAYDVQYAGIDTFRVLVPAIAGANVQIELAPGARVPSIKQRVRVGEAAKGYQEWRVVLQREVTGTVPLRVVYYLDSKLVGDRETPDAGGDAAAEDAVGAKAEPQRREESSERQGQAADGDAATSEDARRVTPTAQLIVPIVQAAGLQAAEKAGTPQVELAQVRGEIVIDKHQSLSVSAMPLDEAVEPIDVRELTLVPQRGTVAFRYFRQPVAVQIAVRRFEIQPVVETVVLRGLVEIVVARDATATYRCRYRIKSSERQRLPVVLPADSELLGVFVNGRSVNPERPTAADEDQGPMRLLVNVARNKPPDVPFSLMVQFRRRLGDVFSFRGGVVGFALPVIGGTDTAMVVQEQMAAVWMPSVYTLLGRPDHFERVDVPLLWRWLWALSPQETDLDEYIGVDASTGLAFPTEGRRYVYRALGFADRLEVAWWNLWFYSWVLGGTTVLVGLVLIRTSWENKLAILLLAAVLAALFSLRYADWVDEAIFAARFGLLATIGLWILHGVLGRSAPGGEAPAEVTTPPVASPPEAGSSAGDSPDAESVPEVTAGERVGGPEERTGGDRAAAEVEMPVSPPPPEPEAPAGGEVDAGERPPAANTSAEGLPDRPHSDADLRMPETNRERPETDDQAGGTIETDRTEPADDGDVGREGGA